jgi:hypothetical protein
MSDCLNESLIDFLLEDWGISEAEIYDRLDLPGRSPICDFGAGVQGIVYMTEDGSFVKVTDDAVEVAFAAQLRQTNLPQFPAIHDVFSVQIGAKQLYAIYRESVDDFLDFDENPVIEKLFIEAMLEVRENSECHQARDRFKTIVPHYSAEIEGLLASLEKLENETGIRISDLHSGNIGRTDDGRVVVRDFGHNNMPQDEVVEVLQNLGELPEPKAYVAA